MKWLLLFIPFLSLSVNAATYQLPVKGADILSGAEVQTGQKGTQGLVVVFVSAKCPCSDSHVVELQQLVHDFPEFEFVGIHSNADEELDLSMTYFDGKKLPFPVIQDQNSELANQFKAYKTPHAFVLDREGHILYQGGVTDSAQFSRSNKKYLREALEDLQAKRPIRTAEGRTLGCVIARSR